MHIQSVVGQMLEVLDAYQSKRMQLSVAAVALDVALRELEKAVRLTRDEWGTLETMNALDLEAEETSQPRTELEREIASSIERLRALLGESATPGSTSAE